MNSLLIVTKKPNVRTKRVSKLTIDQSVVIQKVVTTKLMAMRAMQTARKVKYTTYT